MKKLEKSASKAAGAGKAPTKGASKSATKSATDALKKTVKEINHLHEEVFQATRLTAEKAVEIGERLTRLKKEVGQGKWLLFAADNLAFSAKTAERYMNVFKNRGLLKTKFDTVSNFTLTDAYRFLAGNEQTTADKEPAKNAAEANPGPEKSTLIVGMTRSLCDGLERLSAELLRKFENDLLSFKQRWLKAHTAAGVSGEGK